MELLRHGMRALPGKAVQDLQCLASMWFGRISGTSHKERLESFYSSQAKGYDNTRKDFLHGRETLLTECAARLRNKNGLVWVDLGGGTGENVKTMSKYMDLGAFDKIYVVDLCPSLCSIASEKAKRLGWSNVEIVEQDASDFWPANKPPKLVTFSYSLSMIPSFMKVIDRVAEYLDDEGIVGATDFYTSAKCDKPNRQQSWAQRWFWGSVYIRGSIVDTGHEKRHYLEHKLEPVYDFDGRGKVPYVPVLQAPYYVWIGRKPASSS